MMLFAKGIDFSKYAEKIREELSVIDFEPGRAIEMLKYMGIGMLVIFVIIGIIMLSTVAIQRIFSGKKEK